MRRPWSTTASDPDGSLRRARRPDAGRGPAAAFPHVDQLRTGGDRPRPGDTPLHRADGGVSPLVADRRPSSVSRDGKGPMSESARSVLLTLRATGVLPCPQDATW